MSILSIKINNLLSFDNIKVESFKDINCLVGMNNVGKSNFLKLIQYFYDKLNKKYVLPPQLNNNYTNSGTISITYNLVEIRKIVNRVDSELKSKLFPVIKKLFFYNSSITEYTLTLHINRNNSTSWSTQNINILKILNYLYPFFYINTRDIVLHDWNNIWDMISKIKTYKTKNINRNEYLNFFDNQILGGKKGISNFSQDIRKIEKIIDNNGLGLRDFSHNEKVINYIKSSLVGNNFNFNGEEIDMQSDGTNSSNYLQLFISLFLNLSKTEYIIPTLYIDEPEIGLHPKKCEELIYEIYELYSYLKLNNSKKQFPHILLSTHSPNILKMVIKLFEENQKVLHFSKNNKFKNDTNKQISNTKINILKSTFKERDGSKFLNRFTDSEAKLYFSKFILFVEGESEIELFNLKKLIQYFPILKNVDIYSSSDNIKIKHINPSFSNAAIPFIILYDFDKIVEIKKDIKLKNGCFDFKEKVSIYKKSYPNDSFYDSKVSKKKLYLKYLTNHYKYTFNYDCTNKIIVERMHFEKKVFFGKYRFKEDYTSFLYIMKKYLNLENIFINSKTIESLIINEENINIFLEWLFHELNKNISLKRESSLDQISCIKYSIQRETKYIEYFTKNIKDYYDCKRKYNNSLKDFFKFRHNNKKVKYYKNNVHKNNIVNSSLEMNKLYFNKFNCLFEYSGKDLYTLELNKNSIDVLNLFKQEAIKLIKIDLFRMKQELGNSLFTVFIVLLFNGKTETLLKKDDIKNQKEFKNSFQKIEKLLVKFEYFTKDKTSNWITTFMNYYFNYKENMYNYNNTKDNLIIRDFKREFKELYDIVNSINLRLVE